MKDTSHSRARCSKPLLQSTYLLLVCQAESSGLPERKGNRGLGIVAVAGYGLKVAAPLWASLVGEGEKMGVDGSVGGNGGGGELYLLGVYRID